MDGKGTRGFTDKRRKPLTTPNESRFNIYPHSQLQTRALPAILIAITRWGWRQRPSIQETTCLWISASFLGCQAPWWSLAETPKREELWGMGEREICGTAASAYIQFEQSC